MLLLFGPVDQQAASQGIIRKKGSTPKFLLLVPDQSVAEDYADIPHFLSCRMRPLITPYELPQGATHHAAICHG